MAITASYITITVIGIIYSSYFYSEFQINIIEYTDISDFLLASILEPLPVIIFCSTVVLIVFVLWLEHLLGKRIKFVKKINDKSFAKRFDTLGGIIITLLFTWAAIKMIAERNAADIKEKGSNLYTVNVEGFNSERGLSLLGTSSRYTFFYDKEKSQTLVIPVDNVTYLRKKLN